MRDQIPRARGMIDTIPALSIRQPWPYCILHLGKHAKDIENRGRRFNHRGPLLVHASQGLRSGELLDAIHWIAKNVGDVSRELPVSTSSYQRGGIVGVVDVVDCVEESVSPWFDGPYGLVLANPRPLPFVPYKGQL